MPYFLLFDTNIIWELISDTEYSNRLKRLEFLIKGGYITLLCPTVLVKEWEKHKEERKSAIVNLFKSSKKKVKQKTAIDDLVADLEEDQLQNLQNLLLSQIDTIDDLFKNHSIQITKTDIVDQILINYRREQKAPFHNIQKDNFNDADLIYSSIEYLKKEGITDLFFVSQNIKEFAAENIDPVSLHPDIVQHAKGINIDYFLHIENAFKKFDEKGLPSHRPGNFRDLRKIVNSISIDKKKPIVFQIHEYLKKRFSELEFLPKRLFIEHYPFITSEYFEYYHRPFTLVTDNPEVYKLLKDTRIEEGAIKATVDGLLLTSETEAALKEIFSILFNNFIYRISFKLEKAEPFQYVNDNVPQFTILRRFRNLDFAGILQSLPALPEPNNQIPTKENMQIAFGYYKTGNYKNAAILLNKLRKATENDKSILYYIICFNLKKLSQALSHIYFNDGSIHELVIELDAINLNKAKHDCISKNPNSRTLIEYIHNVAFIKDELPDLYDTQNEIRDLFYGKNSGTTQTTERLIEGYYSIDEFLSVNSIIYDLYSEFKSMAAIYAEGLLMSYGCDQFLAGKLQHFTDPLLIQYITNFKSEDLVTLLNRYALKNLEYSHDPKEDSIYDALSNLLSQHTVILQQFGGQLNEDSPRFWASYGSYIHLSLIIFSYWNIPQEQIASIAEKLIQFLPVHDEIHYPRIKKGIHRFIWQNKEKIPIATLEKFFTVGIHQKDLHDEDYFETLRESLKKGKNKILLSESDFNQVKNNFIGECEICKTSHAWHILGDIYVSLSEATQQEKIQNAVKISLASSFDADGYYLASMYDIITPSDTYNQLYVDEILKKAAKGQKPRLAGSNSFYFDLRIDQFLNFCFKYNLPVPQTINDSLINLGGYYTWLSDMEAFDYDKFNLEWLDPHFTLYYKRKFRTCNALKEHLLNTMKEKEDKDLSWRYIHIYCYND